MIPEGTKIIVADVVLEQLERGTLRDFEGRRISVILGEPDADGFYTPTLRTTDDGYRLIDVAALGEAFRGRLEEHGYIDMVSHAVWVDENGLAAGGEPPDPDPEYDEDIAWEAAEMWKHLPRLPRA